MDLKIILNVIIGIGIYKIIIKSIGMSIIKSILNTKTGKEEIVEPVKSKFKERMEEMESKQINKNK